MEFVSSIQIQTIQNNSIMASSRIETQAYRIVHSDKEFEIRFYPSATLATVYSSASTYRELSGSGFILALPSGPFIRNF
jgi:hypothetical protein